MDRHILFTLLRNRLAIECLQLHCVLHKGNVIFTVEVDLWYSASFYACDNQLLLVTLKGHTAFQYDHLFDCTAWKCSILKTAVLYTLRAPRYKRSLYVLHVPSSDHHGARTDHDLLHAYAHPDWRLLVIPYYMRNASLYRLLQLVFQQGPSLQRGLSFWS